MARDASTGKAAWGRDDRRTSLGCTMENRCFANGGKDSGSGMEPVLERKEARARVEGQGKPIVFWFAFLLL